MRILYTRIAHQEAERDIEFCLDPFNQAKWHVKDDQLYSQLEGSLLDSTEELCDTENIRLITFDNAVIQDLWGASISDLLAYIKEVRTDASNIVRSYETEVSLDGHRITVPLHLKVHKKTDLEGTGFDSKIKEGIVLYVEAEWSEELYDEDYRIYDAEDYQIQSI